MTTFTNVLKDFYEREPDRVSVTLMFPGQPDFPITYRELIERSNDYAAAYARAGVQPGDVVILILQHGKDLIYSFWGAVLLGAIPSMMPFLTEKLSPERYRADLSALFSHSHPTGVVTYPEFEADVKLMVSESENTVKEVFITDRIPRQEKPDFSTLPGMKSKETDVVLLQHSSGSTGLQKGVAPRHFQSPGCLWGSHSPHAGGCDYLLAASLPRHGTDRLLSHAHPARRSCDTDVPV